MALLAVAGLAACGPEPSPDASPSVDPAASAALPAASLGAPQALATPAASGSGQPHLAVAGDGRAVLSWLEPVGQDEHALKFATLTQAGWSTPTTVAQAADFFVNWADFPSVEPITGETWVAHWLKRQPDSLGAYDVAIALSGDGGATWSDGRVLNDDGYEAEHGFASLFRWEDAIGVVWLDGRRLAEELEQEVFDPAAPLVGMTLRFARIGHDGAVLERGELDELACDCCQTDVALTGTGPLVVYRDRTPDEIRDNVAARFAAGRWQPPVPLGPDGWRIEGCPVNGPAVASDGDRTVVAAWFTAPENAPETRFARSTDGGASFSAPIVVDGAGSFGHVDVVLLEDGAAVVSAWRRAATGTVLQARRIAVEGTPGEPVEIARSTVGQPLDVPQMVVANGALVFAWTDSADATVRTATLPLAP